MQEQEQVPEQEKKPTIEIETLVAGVIEHFRIDAEMFNDLAASSILNAILHRGAARLSPEWRRDQLIKAAVKAVFIAQGDNILTSMFGSKNHPKPGKDDDLLEWYMRTFIGVAIWNLAQSGTFMLQGVRNEQQIIEVVAIYPRPVTPGTGGKQDNQTGREERG